MKTGSLALCAMLATLGSSGPFAADSERETIAPAFAHPIANVPGKTMTAIIVSYAPGAKTASHRHGQAFVVGYVLEGSIRSKVDSEEEKVYGVGQSWTERPGAHHRVSENASTTVPAKILAVLVADANAKDLLRFDKPESKK